MLLLTDEKGHFINRGTIILSIDMNPLAVGITIGIILLSVATIYTVSQWDLPKVENPLNSNQPTWVLLQPNKCADIPWRREWSNTTGKSYSEFPVKDELTILETYYEGKGIPITDVTISYQATDPLCTQCGCPESFIYALLVNPSDAARLAVSGFTILDETDPAIFTGPFFRQSTTNPISAVKTSDCEQLFATNTVIDGLLGSKKDSCYIQAAITAGDPAICQNVKTVKPQQTCYAEVAVSLKKVEICNNLSGSPKDSCISSVAGVMQKPSLCTQVSDSTAKYFCELGSTPKN